MLRTYSALVIVAVTLWSAPAYAYLDPGTGSMVLQLLLGGVAGAVMVGKFYWHKIKSVVGLRKEPPPVEKENAER